MVEISSGFYLMHRGWMDNPVFKAEPFCEKLAWIWLIEAASYEPHQMRIRGSQKIIAIKRGQLVTANRVLAEKWTWSVNRVRRFLENLKIHGMIDTQSDTLHTIITICNYDKYQATLRNTNTAPDTLANTVTDTVVNTVTNTVTDTRINKEKEFKERKENTPLPPEGEFLNSENQKSRSFQKSNSRANGTNPRAVAKAEQEEKLDQHTVMKNRKHRRDKFGHTLDSQQEAELREYERQNGVIQV